MPWFLVDDGLSAHPKVTRMKRGEIRERAMGLWTLAGSWSAKYLTEGQIPHEQIAELGCTQAAVRHLLASGMWHATGHGCPACPQPLDPKGFVFHQWVKNGNPTAAQVKAKRAVRAAAGARGGKASGQSRRSKNEANAEANASTIVEPHAMPSQDQTQTSKPIQDLVCRRLFGDARALSDDDRTDLWQLWDETAGQSVDLEAELRKWLIHNTATDLHNPGAALLGWLQSAAKRAAMWPARSKIVAESPPNLGRDSATNLGCDQCIRGWTPDEFGQPSEHRCTACRPHLRAVETS
jgi:hypothetical protein